MISQGIVARATSRELSPKERAVADFYAEHREEAAFLSAAEIAEFVVPVRGLGSAPSQG